MNLIDIFKLITNTKIKRLEAPLEALSEFDRALFVEQEFRSLIKNGTYNPRIFDVINMSGENRDSFVLMLIDKVDSNKKIDEKIAHDFQGQLAMRCGSEELKKDIAYRNIYNFRNVRGKIIVDIAKKLNQSEMNAVLNAYSKVFGRKVEVYELLDQIDNLGVDIPYEKFDYIPEDVSKVSLDSLAQIYKDCKYNQDRRDIIDRYLDTISPEDKLYVYLKCGNDAKQFSFDAIDKVFQKYGDKLSDYEMMEAIAHCSGEDLEKLRSNIDKYSLTNEELQKDFLDIVERKIKIKSSFGRYKVHDEIIEQYKNAKTEAEKDSIFMNLDDDVINCNYRSFAESIKRMPRNVLIERIRNLKSCGRIMACAGIDADEAVELLKKKEFKYTNRILDSYHEQIPVEDMEQLWDFSDDDGNWFYNTLINKINRINYNPENDAWNIDLENTQDISSEKEEIDENGVSEEFKKIVYALKRHLPENSEDVAKIRFFPDFTLSQIEFVAKECIDLLTEDAYYNLDISDMKVLYEYAKENTEYMASLFNKLLFYKNDAIRKKEEFKENELYAKTFIDFYRTSPNILEKIWKNNRVDEFDSFMDIMELATQEERRDLLKNKLFYYMLSQNTQHERIPELFQLIDETGTIAEFYSSINDENIAKIKENMNMSVGKRYSQDLFLGGLGNILDQMQTLSELFKENDYLFFTLNYDLIKVCDGNTLKHLSKYKEMRDFSIADSPGVISLCKKMFSEIEARFEYPEEIIKRCMQGMNDLSEQDSNELAEKMDIDHLIFLMNSNPDFIRNADIQDIINFSEAERKYCNEKINNSKSTKEEVLDAFMRKFFGITYGNASAKVRKYGKNATDLIEAYKSKDELTLKEQAELASLNQLMYIKAILQTDDVELLRESYFELEKDPDLCKINYVESLMQDQNIKCAYNKEKMKTIYNPAKSQVQEEIEYNGKKINVCNPGDEWNMLITVVGAYVQNDNMATNPKAEWNNEDKNVNHEICTSLIGNDNVSMARADKDSVILGFSDLDENDINKEACYDLASNSNGVEVLTGKEEQFMTTKNLVSNTRTGHNEVLLERSKKTESGEIVRRQPNYVIAVNTISESAKRAAADFDVPIVFINTKQLAQREKAKLDETTKGMLQGDITEEDLREMVVKYHNNCSGLIVTDPKSYKQYFSPRKMKKTFNKVADKISKIEDISERKRLAISYKKQLLLEKYKRRENKGKFLPFKFDKIIGKLDQIISEERTEKMDSKKPAVNSRDEYIESLRIDLIQGKTELKEVYSKEKSEKEMQNIQK